MGIGNQYKELVPDLKKYIRSLESALRESEDRYRKLFNNTNDAIYLYEVTDDNMPGRFIDVNDVACKRLGYSKKELLKMTPMDTIARQTWADRPRIMKTLLTEGHIVFETIRVTKEGIAIPVEVNAYLYIQKTKRVILSVSRDITKRKKTEEALRSQAEVLRGQAELLDIAEDSIIVRDTRDRIIFWNNAAEKRYGWDRKEAMQKIVHELLGTEFPEPFEKIRTKLFRSGRWQGELVQTTRSRRHIIVESHWVLRRDQQGKPIAIMEINNDITKRKRAEAALKKAKEELELQVAKRTTELKETNEQLMTELQKRRHIEGMLRDTAERYKDLFVNSPIGIYRTDPDGRIMMANPTLIRMLGYKNTRSVTSSINNGMIYEPTYFHGGIKDALLKQGKVRGFEARWKRPDNTVIFVQENARAIYDKKGEILFYDGTVEDITERKKAEKQIDSYQKKLRSLASELSLTEERERRRIAATLHDNLGQLLAILKIRLGAVTESKATGSTKRELREIRKYIQQGIDYTRSLIFELSPPILHELGLEPALEWLAEQIEEQHGIAVLFENDPTPKPLDDEIRIVLFTAIRELLHNVAKHAGANNVGLSVTRAEKNILIRVSDNGKGFDPQETGMRPYGNKGFGLFSIRERLHHLGGSMHIKSKKGVGTVVVLSAPLGTEKTHTT